jgi:hypothetical protein
VTACGAWRHQLMLQYLVPWLLHRWPWFVPGLIERARLLLAAGDWDGAAAAAVQLLQADSHNVLGLALTGAGSSGRLCMRDGRPCSRAARAVSVAARQEAPATLLGHDQQQACPQTDSSLALD